MLEDWLKRLAPEEPAEKKEAAAPPFFCWPCTIIGLATLAVLAWLVYWLAGLLLA